MAAQRCRAPQKLWKRAVRCAARYKMSYQANHPIESWLAQEMPEEVLEPELPIVDPVRQLSPA